MPQNDGIVPQCAECPGFCCKVFFLRGNKKKVKEAAETHREYLLQTMAEVGDARKLKDIRKLQKAVAGAHSEAFMAKNSIRIRGNKHRKTGAALDRAGVLPQCSNTCKKFDQELGLCGDWANRPDICRNFICDPAKEGRVPTAADFPYTAQFTQREATAVVKRRKRAEKKKAKLTTNTLEEMIKPTAKKAKPKRRRNHG